MLCNNALSARGFFSEEISSAELCSQNRVFKNKVLSLRQLPLEVIVNVYRSLSEIFDVILKYLCWKFEF